MSVGVAAGTRPLAEPVSARRTGRNRSLQAATFVCRSRPFGAELSTPKRLNVGQASCLLHNRKELTAFKPCAHLDARRHYGRPAPTGHHSHFALPLRNRPAESPFRHVCCQSLFQWKRTAPGSSRPRAPVAVRGSRAGRRRADGSHRRKNEPRLGATQSDGRPPACGCCEPEVGAVRLRLPGARLAAGKNAFASGRSNNEGR